MHRTGAGIVLGIAACAFACPSEARAQGSVAEDRAALMAFADAVDLHADRDNAENWGSDRPLGEWHGVTTDGSGRVTKLKVSSDTQYSPPATSNSDPEERA